MKKHLIASFEGISKTYLVKKYKNVLDLESSVYKYNYYAIPPEDYKN